MRVQKRSGEYEDVSFDKIIKRLNALSDGQEHSLLNVDTTKIAQKVCAEIYDGVSTEKLDILSSETAIGMYSLDPDYGCLASRIIISNHHKKTNDSFFRTMQLLHENNIVQDYFHDLIQKNRELIENTIDYSRDYKYDFFGFKTLEKSYLLKCQGILVERPQDLLMRVSLAIHRHNIKNAMKCYEGLSNHLFIHATPTLFNAGTMREQFASCFLLAMEDDSVDGIFNTLKDCAKISKHAGGIGLHIHNIRSDGSFIHGTNGRSNGIVPMLRCFNDVARYIDQGGGKRNGSFAIYLEPWHADIFEFLKLKLNHGNELERARDLFYSLWISDVFMKRVKNDSMWSLMCPNECPGLSDAYGSDFDALYSMYENNGMFKKQIKARELWNEILTCQIETGVPYMLYKDSCNLKSNQNNLGTIRSSNLCTEIVEYSSPEETAVCNLASISLKSCYDYPSYSDMNFIVYTKPNCLYCTGAKNLLDSLHISYETKSYDTLLMSGEKPIGVTFPKIFLKEGINQTLIGGYQDLEIYLRPTYNYDKLKDISKQLTYNLNNIIDYTYYPTEKTRRSNKRHRPIGIGVQGLANVFYDMKIPFDSDEAKELNRRIFETIYFGSLEASMELARDREGAIMNIKNNSDNLDCVQELIQKYDPMEEEYNRSEYLGTYSSYINSPMYHDKLQIDLWDHNVNDELHNWTQLRKDIRRYGVRNSLLVAPMPTASTSQILKNYECFEPPMTNIYSRRVLSGDYLVINESMVRDLQLFNLWTSEMKDNIIANDGSLQNIDGIPYILKERYKTAWEIKQKQIINMSADRGPFICQSQSLNLFLEAPSIQTLTSMHFYAWSKGLKTGMYYLRSRPSSKPIQFTVNPEICESCSG